MYSPGSPIHYFGWSRQIKRWLRWCGNQIYVLVFVIVYTSNCVFLRLCSLLLNKTFLLIFQYRNSTSLSAWRVVAFHHVQSQPRRHGTRIMAQVVPGSIFRGKAVTSAPGLLAITTENSGLGFISESRLFYWRSPLRAARTLANGWQDTTWHTALMGCTLYLICVERYEGWKLQFFFSKGRNCL